MRSSPDAPNAVTLRREVSAGTDTVDDARRIVSIDTDVTVAVLVVTRSVSTVTDAARDVLRRVSDVTDAEVDVCRSVSMVTVAVVAEGVPIKIISRKLTRDPPDAPAMAILKPLYAVDDVIDRTDSSRFAVDE